MRDKKLAESTEEFDRRFDDGEDIHDLIDMSKAEITRHGRRIRVTVSIAEKLIRDIDHIGEGIGVKRDALIKIWLYERVQQEKASKKSEV